MIFNFLTRMNATRFRSRTTMKKILDEDAFSHVSTNVKSEPGEVSTSETDIADPGGLWLMEEYVIYHSDVKKYYLQSYIMS